MEESIKAIKELAAMIHRTMASKEDIGRLEIKMDKGFEKIEKLLIEDHRRCIEHPELQLKELKDALAI